PSVAENGSSSGLRAAEPFVQANAAEACFAQRHERTLLDPAAEVSGLGIAHDLARIADRLQITRNDFVERRSFRTGDLDDAVARFGNSHFGDDRSNIVRRDWLEQAGRNPDDIANRA